MVIQPYMEDRIAHWQVVYSTPLPHGLRSGTCASREQPRRGTACANDCGIIGTRRQPGRAFSRFHIGREKKSRHGCIHRRLGLLRGGAGTNGHGRSSRSEQMEEGSTSCWSGKRARIEKALTNNDAPTLLAKRSANQ